MSKLMHRVLAVTLAFFMILTGMGGSLLSSVNAAVWPSGTSVIKLKVTDNSGGIVSGEELVLDYRNEGEFTNSMGTVEQDGTLEFDFSTIAKTEEFDTSDGDEYYIHPASDNSYSCENPVIVTFENPNGNILTVNDSYYQGEEVSLVLEAKEIDLSWTTEHFNYDGTTVTGFSEAGKALLEKNKDVVIPDKNPAGEDVTAIGTSAFAGTYTAKNTYTSFKLPATVESIGASAFAWGVLGSVNLPEGLTSIGTSAFMNNALESVSIPDSVTTMGDGVYSNNISLKSVTLSKNLTSISQGCFTSCPIDSIVIPEGVTTVAKNAFKGNGATSISLPSTLVTIGDNAFEEAKISELEIPASVKSIGKYAFRIAQSPVKLEKLVLHEGLESIAKQAFKMNAITEVYLPTTVKTLAADAFQDNSSTVKVYYKDPAQAKLGTQTGIKGMELVYIAAKIDDTIYGSLENAVAAVGDGEEATITLMGDVEIDESVLVNNGKNILLDLNGHDIKSNTDNVLVVNGGLLHITGTGSVIENVSDGYAPIVVKGSSEDVANYSVVTIDENVTLKGDYSGIFVGRDASGSTYKNYGIVVNMKGTIDLSDIGTVHGHGMYINGSNTETQGNIASFNLDGARIIGASTGIYAAGYAKWNVQNSEIVSKNTAVEIRAGEMEVNGGRYVATEIPTETNPNGNGTTTTGAAFAVAQHTTALPINVSVKAGTFEGYTGLLVTNPENTGNADKVNVVVEGGVFTATNGGTNSISKDDNAKDVSLSVLGGTFSSDPSSYVAEGYVATKNEDVWTVAKKPAPVTPPTPSEPEKDPISNTGSEAAGDAVTNVDASDSTTATESGKTETTIDVALGDKIVENAKENNVADVVIKAETAKGDATGSTVVLPESTVKALAEKTEASVTIKTDSAEVSLDKTAVEAVAAQAGTAGDVKLVVETKEHNKNKVEIELKLETSNGAVTDFKGGNVTVTVPVNDELAGKKIVCVYIDENGKYTKMEGKLAADGKSYTFTTGHFSTYAILEEAEADAVIAEQNKAEAPSVKVAKAAVKLKAYKGGKLKVTASAKNATGYRVYYKKSTWKKYKTYTKGNVKTLNKTFKKLSKGKYTVKVKAYHKTADGNVTWGTISKARSITVK